MELHDILQAITVNNWYLGSCTALCAWSTGATIESKADQQKIRRALNKAGYIARFSGRILSIEKI